MKYIITSEGDSKSSAVSSVFGRCAFFALYDSNSKSCQFFTNPGQQASGGAGIQAAQLVVDKGAEAVVNHNIGPKALTVLKNANVKFFQINGSTVEEIISSIEKNTLETVTL